ncbi:leucyl aminopeptidase [Magnetofaba australis]|uniref:Probable cytosol aminopeptidase n=1 Tax=Magnetofaba australis IT-1 TaxID=1434232 RepID=A0A1Y2K4K9_9PROT|nr:leucyl aminopeptidase [Magnetofaba australis]OSM02586.1 putative leucyl aminopeptidase [Magnetofaba australis IT-1]
MTELAITIQASSERASAWSAELLIIGVYEGGQAQSGLTRCGAGVAAQLESAVQSGWFKGKSGETLILPKPPRSALLCERILYLGLGKADKITAESLRAVGARIAQMGGQAKSAVALLSLERPSGMVRGECGEHLAQGALLGAYAYNDYKSKKEEIDPPLAQLTLVCAAADEALLSEAIARQTAIAGGVYLTRDLGNTPGNALRPADLMARAEQMAKLKKVKTTILDAAELKKRGYPGILAVGQGSDNAPGLIVMEYNGGGKKQPPVAVVGKAVTFDTGGISLKPGAKMEEMKFDMCGGAAVFGLIQTLSELKLPINVVGVVPVAENMPSGSAQRPGDVISYPNGVTVEVINTDAEGRLILADALNYASDMKPRAIVDFATLTGACVVALGHQCAGLMGSDDDLQSALESAGQVSGDRVWRLPMFAEYHEQIKSKVADIQNVGDRAAGTITAACFLSNFIGEEIPWAHVDIAGAAWAVPSKPHIPHGASGIGVRLMTQYLMDCVAADGKKG